ncbi:hypothetical protein EDC04DRAFT_2621156 [Pisolithus marmoratus]|nr:hypothetical protein EDC04DRAFT_2621156 [Pisolithus marmoratus]
MCRQHDALISKQHAFICYTLPFFCSGRFIYIRYHPSWPSSISLYSCYSSSLLLRIFLSAH